MDLTPRVHFGIISITQKRYLNRIAFDYEQIQLPRFVGMRICLESFMRQSGVNCAYCTKPAGGIMAELLTAKGVTRDFVIGDGSVVHALKGIDMSVAEGRLTILKGRSGSGKTTLINMLGALDRPTSGEVFFDGEDITKLSDAKRDEIRRYKMAFVFQSVALMSSMTAYENVDFGLRLAGFDEKKREERAKRCLEEVGLAKRMDHRPGELSGGEQQRVAIARALAHEPKIIFADEPTAELDSGTSHHIVELFKRLVLDEHMTIVMTTHDVSLLEIADRVYTLEDGEIVD